MQACRSVAVQTQQDNCSRCSQLEHLLNQLYHLRLQQLTRLQTAMQVFKNIKSEDSLSKQCQVVVEEAQYIKQSSEQTNSANIQRQIQIMRGSSRQPTAVNQRMLMELQKREQDRQMMEHSLTEIEQQIEDSFLQGENSYIASLVNHMQDKREDDPQKYNFIVRQSLQNKQFIFQNNTITKKQQPKSNLSRILAIQPISKTNRQQLSFKVIKSSHLYIYFGLVTEQQAKQKVKVYPRNNSAITYLARGGKHLYVLNKNEDYKTPQIDEGSVIRFAVDYRNGIIEWYKNQSKIHTVYHIDFQDKTWYPYVAFRDSGDSVLLL